MSHSTSLSNTLKFKTCCFRMCVWEQGVRARDRETERKTETEEKRQREREPETDRETDRQQEFFVQVFLSFFSLQIKSTSKCNAGSLNHQTHPKLQHLTGPWTDVRYFRDDLYGNTALVILSLLSAQRISTLPLRVLIHCLLTGTFQEKNNMNINSHYWAHSLWQVLF